jgi:hypothetical protein
MRPEGPLLDSAGEPAFILDGALHTALDGGLDDALGKQSIDCHAVGH